MQKLWQKACKRRRALTLESSELDSGSCLVVTFSGIQVFLWSLTALPQNLGTWNSRGYMLLDSVGQEFRQDSVDWLDSLPQCWSLGYKDSKAGSDSMLGAGVIWKWICTRVWHLGQEELKTLTAEWSPSHMASPCGLAFSHYSYLRVGGLFPQHCRASSVSVRERDGHCMVFMT